MGEGEVFSFFFLKGFLWVFHRFSRIFSKFFFSPRFSNFFKQQILGRWL